MPNIFKQGDWAESFMKGMEMARMKEQGEIQREQLQQQQAERKMRMEEFRLKINDMLDKKKEAERIKQDWEKSITPQMNTVEDSSYGFDQGSASPYTQIQGNAPIDDNLGIKISPILQSLPRGIGEKIVQNIIEKRLGGDNGLKVVAPGGTAIDAMGRVVYQSPQAQSPQRMNKSLYEQARDFVKEQLIIDKVEREPLESEIQSAMTAIEGNRKSATSKIDINSGDKVADRTFIRQTTQQMPKLKSEAVTQGNNISRIDQALDLVAKGVTGKGGQIKSFLAPYAEMMGVEMKGLSDAQTFQLLTRVIVGPMRLDIVGPGPVSEWEQKLMQRISGGGGSAKDAAIELLTSYRKMAEAKVQNYNDTLSGLAEIYPNASLIYKPMKIPIRTNTKEKTVIKKFISPSTGKTKVIYSDGTEEIR